MAKILLTSGPTRQFIDPVRYLTNASSGRMGQALAAEAIAAGHDVVVVSGPVELDYPPECEVIPVITTEEMLESSRQAFEWCDGLIGVAAPCDYRPERTENHKITKTGGPISLQLFETPDVVATLGATKGSRWVVGFALETDDHRFRAITKMHRKQCDLIVLNDPSAMDATTNNIEVFAPNGDVVLKCRGKKSAVAAQIIDLVNVRLIAAPAFE